MDPMIPKEMKYNLHYGKVRGDVIHDTFAPPYHPQHTVNSGQILYTYRNLLHDFDLTM